jgi:hypothetical protein
MEKDKESQFLGKDVTIKKINDLGWVRGLCVKNDENGISISIGDKIVFVPWCTISEVITTR